MTISKISRKDQIIEKATELFKVNGFTGTSMRDLAQEVGMEAGSLYSFLNSKEEILQTICFDMAHKFLSNINEATAMENCSNEEKLNQAIQGHVKIITANISATSVFWSEWKYLQQPWLSDFSKLQVEYENKFKSILEAGIATSEFCIDDPTFATMAILSSLNGLQKWRTYSMEPEALSTAFASLFIAGIKN
jgi:TetR/AcrR family transcriptional regulator, cholesterol catabolism regulator